MLALVESGGYLPADPLPSDLTSLLELGLPAGFAGRVETRRFGQLTLQLASRTDQIYFKVYAATDQGPESKHFDDLRILAPTTTELIEAARWGRTHDPSDGFRGELVGLLRAMGVRDAAQLV